jgi:hypothetical protein
MTGYWDRDLDLDLDAIRDWGAAAVVTLLETREFALLRVERLGDEVMRRNMLWFHLPIIDVSTPDSRFEQQWETVGDELRAGLVAAWEVCERYRVATPHNRRDVRSTFEPQFVRDCENVDRRYDAATSAIRRDLEARVAGADRATIAQAESGRP